MPETTKDKKLSLLDSTTIIMGSMIGSGIFIVSASMAQKVNSPGLLIMAWVITGIITILAALSYGELAAMFPKAGGQYVYLREAYNPLFGFLYGWTLFTVIQTGTIAAVGVAFAKFTGVFWKDISDEHFLLSIGAFHITTQQLLAIGIIILLSVYNYRDVKTGALLQNIFTITKVVALLALVISGIYFGLNGQGTAENFKPLFPGTMTWVTIGIFGGALTGSLFSADAWNNITYTAGEVKNPQRNLPLSLLIGTSTVIILYILANFAYLYVLGVDKIKIAENGRVGTLLMQTILGDKGKLMMAALIMISTFGCLNGIIFTAARVYYAMAKDGLFFKQAGTLNRNNVPAKSLTMQCIWSCLLCFSGSYGDLLDYVMFAVMIFYVLTVTGLFILRVKKPDAERPYKTLGYPVLPAIYVLLALLVSLFMILNNGQNCLYGAVIMIAGVPVYYLINRKKTG
ncbi:MAG: amino acid permease [Bacteroidetes bacterium]|nr:amino acid permease [Bacteroidota bacterium]